MDLTKALAFLEKQGLDDCHYQDSGMMEHIAENMQRYADQQLILSGVVNQRELLLKEISNWLMKSTTLSVEAIVELEHKFKQ